MAQIIVSGAHLSKQISGIEICIEVDFNNNTLGLEQKLIELTDKIERIVNIDLELPVTVREVSIKDDLFNLENSL